MFAYFYRPKHGETKISEMIPWFIFLFLIATVIRTYATDFIPTYIFETLVLIAKKGLTITLFLIGSSLSFGMIKKVGVKPYDSRRVFMDNNLGSFAFRRFMDFVTKLILF